MSRRMAIETSSYSPGKEFIRTWWTDKIKPFIDFREYLSQRRWILHQPDIIIEPPPSGTHLWRSPLRFALQGLAVPAVLVSVVASVSDFFVKPIDPPWREEQNRIEFELLKLKYEPANSNPELIRTASEELRARLKPFQLASHVAASVKTYLKAGPTFSVIIGAYCFGFFLRRGIGRNAVNAKRALEVYLYFITSCLFWYGIVGTFGVSVLVLVDSSGISSLAFDVLVGLAAIDALNARCMALPRLFGLPFWPGTHKIVSSVLYSNMLVTILLTAFIVFSSVSGIFSYWVDTLRVR
jgi:hypothetical protein